MGQIFWGGGGGGKDRSCSLLGDSPPRVSNPTNQRLFRALGVTKGGVEKSEGLFWDGW